MKDHTMNNNHIRTGLLLIGTLLLASCTADHLHREGLSLLENGRYEDGLGKLHEAVVAEPNNARFRTDERRSREQIVARLAVEANVARATNQKEQERLLYERILRIEPLNSRALAGIEMLGMDQRHAKALEDAKKYYAAGNYETAAALLKSILIENPAHAEAGQLHRQILDMSKEPLQETALMAKFKKPVTLQFRDAPIKSVLESLSRVSGINILLDKDVKPDIKVTLFVKDVSVEDAIGMILMQSQLERKVMSDNMLFIYPNTQAKTKDYQDLVVRSFHLTNADPKAIQSLLKTILKTNAIFVNEKTNSIVIRDTAEAVQLAEKLITDQDIPEPEVMMEVEVLEVSRTRLTDLGILWPSQLSLTAIGTGAIPGAAAGAVGATVPTLNQLRNINGNNIITNPNLSLTLRALMTDTDTNIIASPRIRAKNREKAKIMIGERVPIITQAATPVTGGAATVVTANVRYIDVGLSLEVEPDIHLDSEVAIKVNMEVSSITNTITDPNSGTRAYQIGTRNASTLLQLRDGETQILGGLIDNETRNTANRVPGIGQLPGIGRLFSTQQDNGAKTEIILSITPHIVNKPRHPEARDVQYWSGTEATLRARPIQARSLSTPGGLPVPAVASAAPVVNPPAALPVAMGKSQGARLVPPVSAPSNMQMSTELAAPAEAPVAPPPTPSLALSWSAPKELKIGDRLTVPLEGRVMAGSKGLEFQVGYETSMLRLLSVTPGTLVKTEQFSQIPNEANGSILIGLSDTGEAGNSGRIATLEFEVLGSSSATRLTLEPATSAPASAILPPPALSFVIPEAPAENAP